jgi:hypothetical protein
MLAPTKQVNRLACFIACGLLMCAPQLPSASATKQSPPTVVSQKDGKWRLRAGYLGGSRIFVIDAKHKTKLLLFIKDAFPREDYKKYVTQSTAGPEWEDYALWYFVTLERRLHFCIRTWWDGRILIDLEAAKQVSDRPHKKALVAFEKQHVLNTLEGGVKLMAKWQQMSLDKIQVVHAAAHLTGRVRLKEAAVFLRRLEQVDYSGSSISGWFELENLKNGDINPASYWPYETRRIVQRSLRQLGERPKCYPATLFHFESGKEYEPKKTAEARHHKVSTVKVGMKPSDVLDALGPPDYVDSGQALRKCVWRYDMDAPKPFSLLVVWEEGPKVKGLEKVEPALWKRGQK